MVFTGLTPDGIVLRIHHSSRRYGLLLGALEVALPSNRTLLQLAVHPSRVQVVARIPVIQTDEPRS